MKQKSTRETNIYYNYFHNKPTKFPLSIKAFNPHIDDINGFEIKCQKR